MAEHFRDYMSRNGLLPRGLGLITQTQKLLIDFMGQPSLITTTAFANGFLWYDFDIYRSNFISYGWKEALQEGLKEKCPYGGRKLWALMVSILKSVLWRVSKH